MNAPGGAMSVSLVQGNPMGAADLQQIRRSRTGQTLRCRPDAPLHRERGGEEHARGIVATPVAAAVRDEVLRRGTPRGLGTYVGRRACQVTRALSDPASRCLPPPVPQSWRSGNPDGNGSRSSASRQRGSGLARWLKRPRNGEETHGRQRPRWPRSEREGNRRGGEKPRGRNMPGEATPGRAGPLAHVVEG